VRGRGLDLDDLGEALVVLLLLVGGVGYRPWHGVVLLLGDDQQRATIWIVGVDLRLGPRVEVSGTARIRLAGLPSTGNPDFNAEIGSGKTPRNGAGSIATDAAVARVRPGFELAAHRKTPIMLALQAPDDCLEVVGDLTDRLAGGHSRICELMTQSIGASYRP
jgi:hypothetical protein